MAYTIEDLRDLIPEQLTPRQEAGVLAYVNDKVIPKADPCQNCEPNTIRKLISRVQTAERNGEWPPKQAEQKPKTGKVELVNEFVPAQEDAPSE